MAKLHLLCNAHLDPVWQWEWEEGAAAAVSTFRAAAEFIESYDGFVFNHNEAILYKWIEEYEPALFRRIQSLVKQGRWSIMGGWYLQPDCNMPSGESIVRQILLGRVYFQEKFGVTPTTAINFDSFGHSRGLVQIMRQSGFDSYIFMRPDERIAGPAQQFRWVGFDGSEVLAYQIPDGYNTLLGQAHKKVEKWLDERGNETLGLVHWGVGNHGGGPSRLDLDRIGALMETTKDVQIFHSTPEQYFADLAQAGDALPSHASDLNPRFVGCYTSMIRVKQKHRQLENELFLTEKMLSAAAIQGLTAYPEVELHEAICDLMVSEFHDILPGSSVQPAEEASLRLIEHGLEIASRLKARAFFALASGQPKASEGEYPILVYNPHPFPVLGVFACEFMLADQNWNKEFSMPVVYRDGVKIPSQPEKEFSNLNLDWRKRVVFEANLAPSQMSRFDCRIELHPQKPVSQLLEEKGLIRFVGEHVIISINTYTGLLDEYTIEGVSYIQPNAFLPIVVADNEDSWRVDTNRFEPVIGAFHLMNRGEGSDFSGVKNVMLPSVRVIEDGQVRTVIEAVFAYNNSTLCLTYKLPKQGTEVEVHIRVYWNEKDKLLKLSIPTTLDNAVYLGQTAYGVQELPTNGEETVTQKWTAATADHRTMTVINNGIYGSDFHDGTFFPTLLRSPGYCALAILDRPIMEQDRFAPRIDQGERVYMFWLNAGNTDARLSAIDREALFHNEKPYALSFFPSGEGVQPKPMAVLTDEVVQMTAFKKEERGEGYIIRLFEPTGTKQSTKLCLPALELEYSIELSPFEIRTLRLDVAARKIHETDLMESLIHL